MPSAFLVLQKVPPSLPSPRIHVRIPQALVAPVWRGKLARLRYAATRAALIEVQRAWRRACQRRSLCREIDDRVKVKCSIYYLYLFVFLHCGLGARRGVKRCVCVAVLIEGLFAVHSDISHVLSASRSRIRVLSCVKLSA